MAEAFHIILGKEGEKKAAFYLEDKGYTILAKNWRFRRCEIDLIAGKDREIVFVEVKTRRNEGFGEPELAVTKAKQAKMAEAAAAFMENIKPCFEPRFDIIAILNEGEQEGILHFEDAFFPNWLY